MKESMDKEMALVRDRNLEIAHNINNKCKDTKVEPLPERFKGSRVFVLKTARKNGDNDLIFADYQADQDDLLVDALDEPDDAWQISRRRQESNYFSQEVVNIEFNMN